MEAGRKYLFIVRLATTVVAELNSKEVKLTANLSITKLRLVLSKVTIVTHANVAQLSFLPLEPIKAQQPLPGI